jgi:regulator of sigma E protease
MMFALLLVLGPGRATTTVAEVEREVRPGQATPASQIGLQPGDRIVAINGTPVNASRMFELIVESEGNPIRVTVERNGRDLVLGPVRPFEDTDGAYRIGFRPRFEDLPVLTAVGESFRLTWLITREIGGVLGRLVQGSGREEISSPIGIVRGSSDALDRGWETYLWVLGLISLSLALLNLLPLLPLDGGHIAFSLIEGVRGRAVGREVYERVSVVGIAVVLLLFFIGLSNDIGGRTGG